MNDHNQLPTQLNGWTDIAAFFGKSPETVQRWESQRRLPVRLLRSEAGDVVYAFAHELEAWRDERTRLGDDLTGADE